MNPFDKDLERRAAAAQLKYKPEKNTDDLLGNILAGAAGVGVGIATGNPAAGYATYQGVNKLTGSDDLLGDVGGSLVKGGSKKGRESLSKEELDFLSSLGL